MFRYLLIAAVTIAAAHPAGSDEFDIPKGMIKKPKVQQPPMREWTVPVVKSSAGGTISLSGMAAGMWRPPGKRYGWFNAKVIAHEGNRSLQVKFNQKARANHPLVSPVAYYTFDAFLRLYDGRSSWDYEIGEVYSFDGLFRMNDTVHLPSKLSNSYVRTPSFKQLTRDQFRKQFKEQRAENNE